MRGKVEKQICYGAMLIVAPLLFFSCSSSQKALSASSGKHSKAYDDEKFKAVFYNAEKQKILGNYEEAMDLFRQCLAINPDSPAANFEVAEILEYNKLPDSSLAYLNKAVHYDPENTWYKYFYTQNLQELGRYKEVIKIYQDMIKEHPETTDLYYKLALAQLQAKEYKEAVETYDKLEQKTGSVDEDIAMSKIEVLEQIKEYSRAEEEIKKLIKSDSSTSEYYDMLGNLYQLEGKNDKAFQEYKNMEQIHPHDPMVHLSLADYYKIKNEDAPAYDELKKAFQEPSLDVDTKVRIILGLSTFTNTDSIFSEALALSQIMVKANPTEPKAHAVYAELLIHNKNLPDARTQYRLAVSEDSSKYNYWSELLDIETRLNDIKDLEHESKEAMGLFPTNAQLYYYNGFANMQLKNFDEALNSFKAGIFYVLNDSTLLGLFYSNIGDADYYTRHFASSDSAYEQALIINPKNDYVLNNYSYYLSVRDTNLALAEKMSKKSNELIPNSAAYEDTYGWILYMSGKYTEAEEWENKAMTNGGDRDATILEHYGDILFKLGKKDTALQYWIKAKDAGPGSDLLGKKIRDKQLYEKQTP